MLAGTVKGPAISYTVHCLWVRNQNNIYYIVFHIIIILSESDTLVFTLEVFTQIKQACIDADALAHVAVLSKYVGH